MKNKILLLLPLAIILLIWQVSSLLELSSYISSPSEIIISLYNGILKDKLLYHTLITAYEALVGLILGLVIGCAIGFSLIYFPNSSKIAYPYLVALSAIPTFALGPIMIIWFGIGLEMKIVLSFLATVFTTTFQAYEGASKVSNSDKIFFNLNHASNKQTFWMLSFPSSIDWVIQSLKLNSGFCILGAFIGEFLASQEGIGHVIVEAGRRYDAARVFAALLCIIFLSFVFSSIATIINKHKLGIIRYITSLVLPKDNNLKGEYE